MGISRDNEGPYGRGTGRSEEGAWGGFRKVGWTPVPRSSACWLQLKPGVSQREELPHWLVYLENNSGSCVEHGWRGRSTELQHAGQSPPGERREQRAGDPLAWGICREVSSGALASA